MKKKERSPKFKSHPSSKHSKIKFGKMEESESSYNDKSESEKNLDDELIVKRSDKRRRKTKHGSIKPSKSKYLTVLILFSSLLIFTLSSLILSPTIYFLSTKYSWTQYGSSSLLTLLSLNSISAIFTISTHSSILIFYSNYLKEGRKLSNVYFYGLLPISLILTGVTVLVALSHSWHVFQIFDESFLSLIQEYDSEEASKVTMDRIQMDFECCGFYSYEDWKELPSFKKHGDSYVPFSCCSVHTLSICLNSNVPPLEKVENEGSELELTFNYVGCKFPMETYYKKFIKAIFYLSSLSLTCQVIVYLLLYFGGSGTNNSSSAASIDI